MAKKSRPTPAGKPELRQAWRQGNALFFSILIFSVFVNLLMLTGPLFMLQVYDRVLGSGSEETLVALSALVAFLFVMMGTLDYVRGRVAARAANKFQSLLDLRVFDAVLRSAADPKRPPSTGIRDLEAVQRAVSTPVFMAIFDIPWTPLFLFGIFLFHPWLGIAAMIGGGILILVALTNQMRSRGPSAEASAAHAKSETLTGQLRNESETIQALGMRGATFSRWGEARVNAQRAQLRAADTSGLFTMLTKTFRQFLQSAMLALGAYLVLQGSVTGGAMIASSILLGRALAPIEQAVGQWSNVQAAFRGWRNLGTLLEDFPTQPPRTALPRPSAKLDVQQLTIIPPGQKTAALKLLNFSLEPGQAVGVIGASGAGKSTLARALTGIWRPAGGSIRLDGASLDQFEPDVLGSYVGYLPQRVVLFEGTIAENIAKMAREPDAEKVVAAAKKAAAHDMIVSLPQGYDTRVTANGGNLSGGQLQRIGLARALYDEPVILVLDEPNSNLDNEGSMALNTAIRQAKEAGSAVLIMAHRPAAIQECDLLLVIEGGTRKAFGPRDEILRDNVKNHAQISRTQGTGGVS